MKEITDGWSYMGEDRHYLSSYSFFSPLGKGEGLVGSIAMPPIEIYVKLRKAA